tara:strand:+ start:7298 stop:7654 length:357 start_codon:yes stop_codon:yes gene_type:complete
MTDKTETDYQRLNENLSALTTIVEANYLEGTKIMEDFASILRKNTENSLEVCDAVKLMNEKVAEESAIGKKMASALIELREGIGSLADAQVALDNRLLKHAQVIHMNQLKTPKNGGEL